MSLHHLFWIGITLV